MSGRSEMSLGTIGEVQDGLGDHRLGPGRVRGPARRFGTGQGTLGGVRGGSGEPRGGTGRVMGS